ncbi:hypothetical protein D3C72_1880930 [compost metagenome]
MRQSLQGLARDRPGLAGTQHERIAGQQVVRQDGLVVLVEREVVGALERRFRPEFVDANEDGRSAALVVRVDGRPGIDSQHEPDLFPGGVRLRRRAGAQQGGGRCRHDA